MGCLMMKKASNTSKKHESQANSTNLISQGKAQLTQAPMCSTMGTGWMASGMGQASTTIQMAKWNMMGLGNKARESVRAYFIYPVATNSWVNLRMEYPIMGQCTMKTDLNSTQEMMRLGNSDYSPIYLISFLLMFN